MHYVMTKVFQIIATVLETTDSDAQSLKVRGSRPSSQIPWTGWWARAPSPPQASLDPGRMREIPRAFQKHQWGCVRLCRIMGFWLGQAGTDS